MKRTIALSALLLSGAGLNAQQFLSDNNFEVRSVNAINRIPSFVVFQKSDLPDPGNMDQWFRSNMNANADFHLRLVDSAKDLGGNVHSKFMQYYHGIPVAGSMVQVHHKGTLPYSFNGTFYPQLTTKLNRKINERTALTLALKRFAVNSVFVWESPWAQIFPPQDKRNEIPQAAMVIISKGDDQIEKDFRLAYKFDIFSVDPLTDSLVYVDAMDGSILYTQNLINETDKIGIAHTKYSGIQSITCDSIASAHYELGETGRADLGIFTLHDITGDPFVDDNNDWNNINAAQDEVATDVHWGLEKAYDFYKLKFSRNSTDDRGKRVIGSVHYGTNYIGAWSLGSYSYYGDGNDSTVGPFTTLDIVGHEYTHGVTSSTSGLKYSDESGALNESFSDIFGKCIEHQFNPSGFNWGYANAVYYRATFPWRNFKDPVSSGLPKYYHGLYYYYGSADAGGVHTNSTVQTFWFYLLCEGGSGVRESDLMPYTVRPIGWDKAMAIAYANLTNYLTSSSQYTDAALCSIEAAKLLYGASSDEVYNVQMAWYAVGLADMPEKSTVIEPVSFPCTYSIHPNPAKDIVYITSGSAFRDATLKLMDRTGQILQTKEHVTGLSVSLDVSSMPVGIYLVEIIDQENLSAVEVVKY